MGWGSTPSGTLRFKKIDGSFWNGETFRFADYNITYNIAFQKHLKALMWTEGDFYDEANHLSYTDDLDIRYSRYDMNTDFCDSDEEYYEKIRMNESIENEYSNRYSQAIRLLKNKIIANDIIEFNGILCELV